MSQEDMAELGYWFHDGRTIAHWSRGFVLTNTRSSLRKMGREHQRDLDYVGMDIYANISILG